MLLNNNQIMKVNTNRIVIKQEADWTLNLIVNMIQCKICLNIMNNPFDCKCCNETFCEQCITHYISINKKCPFANNSTLGQFDYSNVNGINCLTEDDQANRLIEDLKPSNNNVNKLIAGLKFSCENKINGCNVELSLIELNDHAEKCKFKTISYSTDLDKVMQSSNKDKFKFQDSCMSFQKIEISNMNNNYNCPQQQFNNKIMDKIDHMIELLTCLSIEPKHDMNSPKHTYNSSYNANHIKPNKQNLSKDMSMPTSSEVTKKYKRNETPKFKSRQPDKDVNHNTIHILSSRLELLTNKITGIERTIQTVSSLNTQQYSIKDNLVTTKANNKSSSCSNINLNKTSELNKASANNNKSNIIMNCNTEQSNTIIKNISFNLNNSLMQFPRLKKESSIDKSKGSFKSMLTSTKNQNKLVKMNTAGNRNTFHNHSLSKKDYEKIKVKEAQVIYFNDFETLINNKDSSLRKFIEEKVISTIIEHFDDLNLNSNKIIDKKLKEIKEILDYNKQEPLLSKQKCE